VALFTRVDREVTEADTIELWPVYQAVFADQPDLQTWRTAAWDKHAARDGFQWTRAYNDEKLVGFAYGYTGERGQWWTDRAFEVLPAAVAAAWLDGHFEVVSIGVLPQARRRGLGRALLHEVTRGLPHERWLLMTTADEAEPARRMYDSDGWRVIGPGVGDDTVILAKGRPRTR
jgi:ribosomal protein S18 acetylase RimI-like enzyme